MRTSHILFSSDEKRSSFLLTGCLIAGIIAGSVYSCCFSENGSPVKGHLLLPFFSGSVPGTVFLNTSLSLALLISAVFITGTCALAQPLGIAFTVYLGAETGISAASRFISLGSGCITELLMFFLPKAVVMTVLCCIAVHDHFSMSTGILSCLVNGSDISFGIKRYALHWILLIGASILFSALYSFVFFLLNN